MYLTTALIGALFLGQSSDPVLSQMPVTYVLDYGPAHVGSADYIDTIAKAPPTFLHLGKDVPFTHNWGPIQALGGENQAYGKMRPYGKTDDIRRLSPDEVRQRIADLSRLTADLHRVGVKWVMPYICSMTIGGRPEPRAGFWEFYDHWNDYAAFGLGPRPASDPIEWLQRKIDGKPNFYYTFVGPFYPAYEPNLRYAVCQNHPDWRTWTEKVVENIARCGFDGVFVDNGGSLRCYCPSCQKKWRAWIAARWSESSRRELFGTAEPAMGETGKPGLLWAETCRFWNASLAEHHAAIARAGSQVLGRPFLVFPNGGEHRPEQILLAHANADFIMFERSYGPYGTNPGMVLWPVVEDITVRKYNDNIFENKFVQCLRRKVRPIMLTRPGYNVSSKVRRLLEMTPDSATLGCAETAAFGAGGGFLVRVNAPCMAAQDKYRKFMESHASLFEGLDSFADVGVAVLPQQVYFGNTRHQSAVRQVTQFLLDSHVLFDYLIDDQFCLKNLRKYRLIVLPDVTQLAAVQDEDLAAYVQEGGKLLILGPLPDQDEKGQKLASSRVSTLSSAPGKGKVTHWAKLATGLASDADRLAQAAGENLSILRAPVSPATAKVRVNAFQQPGQSRWILHVLNYNVPLGTENRDPETQSSLEFRLRLPSASSGKQAWKLVSYDPAGSTSEIPVKQDGQSLTFTLPELQVHRIIEVRTSGTSCQRDGS
jgi:hypothetical protein